MARAVNTLVFGSPESAEQAADAIDRSDSHVDAAERSAQAGRSTADSGWAGGAALAFYDATEGLPKAYAKLSHGTTWQDALRDWGSAIRAVKRNMDQLLHEAKSVPLPVSGPIFFPPHKPTAPTNPHTGPVPTDGSDDTGPVNQRQYNKAVDDYNAKLPRYNHAVDDYNTKVARYNDLQTRAREQRKKEDEAHADLRSAFKSPDADAAKNLSKALTGAESGRSAIDALDTTRKDILTKNEHLQTNAQALEDIASGRMLTEKESATLKNLRAQLKDNAASVKVVRQWDSFLHTIPASVRRALVAHPAQGWAENPDAPKIKDAIGKASRSVPYVGATLVAGKEALGAWGGKQTWTQAGVNAGSQLAVDGASGRLGSAVGGMITGGPGGALVGSLTGMTAVNKIVSDFKKGWQEGKAEAHMDKYWADVPNLKHKHRSW